MPPKSNRKGGKKKKRSGQSEAAVTCAQCARKVSRSCRGRLECVCTRVVFCSETCRDLALSEAGTHSDCLGPLKSTIDVGNRLSKIGMGDWSTEQKEQQRNWQEEYQRTVINPILASGLFRGKSSIADPPLEDLVRHADAGNTECAYMAGVKYKQRLLGQARLQTGGKLVFKSRSTGEKQLGMLASDELAFQYMSQAANAGLGLAMQSLADCYEDSRGVRVDMRLCKEWLWRAALKRSSGALDMLETKSVLSKEHMSQVMNLDRMGQSIPPGASMGLSGPNISSLLIVLHREIVAMNYTLPAFAAAEPTLCVGTRPKQGKTGPVSMLGTETLQQVVVATQTLEGSGHECVYTYGRRGVAKQATAQSLPGGVCRSLDAHLFVVPPAPCCDDTPTDDDAARWVAKAWGGIRVHCVHLEGRSPMPVCRECIDEALERLRAVASGSVLLSLQEFLPERGHIAIYRQPGGKLKSETFKAYGRGEVECALATLASLRDGRGGALAHPMFVAQDPNLFWPIIFSHGSVRAALEYVSPYLDWTERLGKIVSAPERVPIVTAAFSKSKPGNMLRKCGNESCLRFEPDSKECKDFKLCGRCQRRCYCSQTCAKADWVLHKKECKAAAAGSAPAAEPVAPSPSIAKSASGSDGEDSDHGFATGEELVVHGLVSKPEFNGCLCVVRGRLTSHRYPVRLPKRERSVLLKPDNLCRLGATVLHHRKKATQFQCMDHGSAVCSICCLDFGALNHLSKTRYFSCPLPHDAVVNITETHFAAIEKDWGGGGVQEFTLDTSIPMECQGLKDTRKQFVLKSLLQEMKPSLPISAAVAGMICYGARSCPGARESAALHLEKALEMLPTASAESKKQKDVESS